MLASTLSLAAASLGVVQSLTLLGQARTLRRLGTAREVSLPFLLLAVLSSTTWLGYGTVHRDVALLLVNAVGLAGAAVTLTTAVRLRSRETAALRLETGGASSGALLATPTESAASAPAGSAPVRVPLSELAPFDPSVPGLAIASAA